MSQSFFLLLGGHPDQPLTWQWVNDAGVLKGQGKSDSFAAFAQMDQLAGDERIIGLLPGEDVAFRVLPNPPRGGPRLQAAARFLLEDSIAEPIDEMHVCPVRAVFSNPGVDAASGFENGRCLAVSHAVMATWIEAFEASGVFPDFLTADFLALPFDDNPQPPPDVPDDEEDQTDTTDMASALTLFIHTDGILAHGHQGGFAMDRDIAELAAGDLIRNWKPDHIDLYAERIQPVFAGDAKVVHHDQVDMATLARLFFESFENSKCVPNLLSGPYRRKINWRASLEGTAGLAAGLAAALIFSIILWFGDGVRHRSLAQDYRAQATNVHAASFPQARNADPFQHARRVLSGSGQSADFLSLWTLTGEIIAEEEGVRVETITFTPDGEARISIVINDVAVLERVKSAFRARGFSAQEGRLNEITGTGQYNSELTVNAS